MSEFTQGLNNTYAPRSAMDSASRSSSKSNSELDMTDFLQLIVAQFQNQSMDDTASTSDMLNQLVQISVVQAISSITDATVMSYAGSLVGKDVTIGQYDDKGEFHQFEGTVTGTGTYGGQQVVFVNEKSYFLSEIMAIGRLPKVEEPEDPDGDKGDGGKGDGGDVEKPDETPEAR